MPWNGCRTILVLGILLLLSSCSSGSTGSSSATSAGFTQTYTASATAGEILTYTIDTQNLTYSYKIVYSAYGLTNATGNGTLIHNPDGSYSPSNAPSTKAYAVQNGLLIGTVNLTLNSVPRTVPLVGMSQPITTQAALAGTYNFAGIQCANQTFGVYSGCTSSYGTVQLDNAGNYTMCPSANIVNGQGGCSTVTTGALSLLDNGVWQAVRTGSTNTNYLLAFAAPNGQNVLLWDLNDPGGYGYAFLVLSTQAAYVQNLVDGQWFYQSNNGTAGSLMFTGTHVTDTNGNVSVMSNVNFDSPWTGLNDISTGGLTILAGTGALAAIDPGSPGIFEVGMKK